MARTPQAETIELRPVGVVRVSAEGASEQTIEVFPPYADALLNVEMAGELQILYWMHLLDESGRQIMTAHPRGDRSKPLRGVFALRSPMRPNPIGSTVVKLLRREGNRLTVSGLDAKDGSPVVDIKITS